MPCACMYAFTYECLYACMYKYTFIIYVCMCVYVFECTYVYMKVWMPYMYPVSTSACVLVQILHPKCLLYKFTKHEGISFFSLNNACAALRSQFVIRMCLQRISRRTRPFISNVWNISIMISVGKLLFQLVL